MERIVYEVKPANRTADQGPGSDDSNGDGEAEVVEGGQGGQSRVASKRPRRRPGAKTRVSRALTLEVAARESLWLRQISHGWSREAIAKHYKVSLRRVRFGLARARAQQSFSPPRKVEHPPRLIPLFPIGPYTPQSFCAHRQPIRLGSNLCCMVCHRSGMDHHPALQRDKATEPAPEPVPAAPKKGGSETRKQRRRRLFAARADAAEQQRGDWGTRKGRPQQRRASV